MAVHHAAGEEAGDGRRTPDRQGDLAAGFPYPAFGYAQTILVVYRNKGGIRGISVGEDKALPIPVR